MKRLLVIYTLLTLFLLNAKGQTQENWSVVDIAGHPVGYYYTHTKENAQIIETEVIIHLVLNRLGNKVEMYSSSMFVENAEGAMVEVHHESKLSDQSTQLKAKLEKHNLVITSSIGEQIYIDTLPQSDIIVGPGYIQNLTVSSLKNPGDFIEYSTFIPDFGKVVRVKRTLVALSSDGLEVKEEIPGFPSGHLLIANNGTTLEMRIQSPFGVMLTRLASKGEALAAAEGTILPSEMFDQTLIRSNVRFANARAIDKMVIKITGKNPDLGLPDLEGDNQKVLEKSDKYIILQITRPNLESTGNHRSIVNLKEYMAPNVYINSDDPEIVKVAQQFSEEDTIQQYESMKHWVTKNMGFDLGITMAPASEIIKNRKGTCTEYATLLTALYRAHGFPARVALGFVYMGGIWGGHAWTEVYYRNQWIPFDAAINASGPADAARFRFVAASLKEGLGELNRVEGIQMYGNAQIEVLSYTIAGETIEVAQEKAYTLAENRYTNPGLGLEVKIPEGCSFENMDNVWPAANFLSVVGPEGETVNFSQIYVLGSEEVSTSMKAAVEKITGAKAINKGDSLIAYAADKMTIALAIQKGCEYILVEYKADNARTLFKKVQVNI